MTEAQEVACHCGSRRLEQLVSRVAMLRSDESRLENLADPSGWGDIDENDPKSLARMMKKLGGELGEDLGPEFNEAVDRLEAGEDPGSIENSLGVNGDSGGDPSVDTDNLF